MLGLFCSREFPSLSKIASGQGWVQCFMLSMQPLALTPQLRSTKWVHPGFQLNLCLGGLGSQIYILDRPRFPFELWSRACLGSTCSTPRYAWAQLCTIYTHTQSMHSYVHWWSSQIAFPTKYPLSKLVKSTRHRGRDQQYNLYMRQWNSVTVRKLTYHPE